LYNILRKCIKLLRDLILLTNGQRPEWAPQGIQIPRSYGLDIMNSVLKQAGPLMRYSKEAHQLIKKELIPIITSYFESKSYDFLGRNHSIIFI